MQAAPPPPAVAAPTPQPAPPPPAVAATPVAPVAFAPPADGRYPIQLERRAIPGTVFRVHARGVKKTRKQTRIPGQPVRNETEQLTIELSGLVRVAAVDQHGDATRLDVQVEQCATSSTNGPETLLPPGALLVVESALRPARGRFVVGGREPDPRLTEYLAILFSRSHGPTSDDDAFGTPTPRRAGERWEPNTAVIATDLAEQVPGLTPGDVGGRVTFYGPVVQDGQPSLDLGVKLQVRARAMPNLPPGTVLERGDLRIEMRGSFPRDARLPSLRDRASMNLRARLRIPTAAGTATLNMEIDESKELERSLVSP